MYWQRKEALKSALLNFRWKSAWNLESVRCCKEAGNLCDVTLVWDDGCLQCLPWKVKVVQIQLFQPTWVMLWRVFWKTKITNIYTRLPKAKADPEEGGMGQQRKSSPAICSWTQFPSNFFSRHVGLTTCLGSVLLCFNPLSCCLRFVTTLFVYLLNKHDSCWIPKVNFIVWNVVISWVNFNILEHLPE